MEGMYNVLTDSIKKKLVQNFSTAPRFDFLFFSFPHYDDLTVRFITYTMNGTKIPFNQAVERRLFQMGLEFTKRDTKHIFKVNVNFQIL